jgi:hypothetical protein
MSDHDKAKSLVLRFRHYATEFRSARNYNPKRNEKLAIPSRLTATIIEAIENLLAPDELVRRYNTKKAKYLVYRRATFFRDSVGFRAVVSVIPDPDEWAIVPTYSVYLKPGWAARLWPGVFRKIHVGLYSSKKVAEAAKRNAIHQYRFDVLGYYAQACDLLADWIENHAIDEQSTDDHPADGLDKEGKAFTWGGVRFDRLTPAMMRVLGLLLDERKKGHPNVPALFIRSRAEVAIDSGMKSQVFKLNRKGWPPVHPVSEIVQDNGDATYRLIDPDKVPGKIPDRSGDHS